MAAATVATAPGSCELNKLLNRNWALQIKKTGDGDSAWKFVRGLDTISVNIETSAVDASDLDSDGWESQVKTSRKLTVVCNGKFAVVRNAKELEPSQKLLYDTGIELGAEGQLDVRVWRTDGTDEGWEMTATNTFTTNDGGANDMRTFTANLQSSCAPRRIKPVLTDAVTKASVPYAAA
ncbi:hypothetical protein C1Y63_04725 [Corynebacterium sp. 13CS0277]|uniref:phage tail tube protein n=1 Tax=Corynebacterium sp. 13CS0277 TaxID=2071994 RepID=UPI000D039CEF|nr:hypothetical protein [Corynebacterium sp. 13CS0277]PRQ11716.1 hypothetical protein C1Y63_04725 [Corynebacterium sp. 13CS0277]